jgi:hypothetical protein
MSEKSPTPLKKEVRAQAKKAEEFLNNLFVLLLTKIDSTFNAVVKVRFTFTKAETFPTFDQKKFPALPSLKDIQLLQTFTPWGDFYKSTAACALISACCEAGVWKPITAEKYFEVLSCYPNAHLVEQERKKALHELIESGEIEALEVEGKEYFVPTLSMVRTALQLEQVQVRYFQKECPPSQTAK